LCEDCGCTRQVEDGGCKKLHSDELHTLYSSSILQVVKTKCIGWAGYVARTEKNLRTNFWSGNFKGKEQFRYLHVGRRIILKRCFFPSASVSSCQVHSTIGQYVFVCW